MVKFGYLKFDIAVDEMRKIQGISTCVGAYLLSGMKIVHDRRSTSSCVDALVSSLCVSE